MLICEAFDFCYEGLLTRGSAIEIATHAQITQLCARYAAGERGADDDLFANVYDELRAIANRLMAQERPQHTLQPTALVNEAFLRLRQQKNNHWNDRRHFFAIAATFMRRILVDHARQKQAAKRGAGQAFVTFSETLAPAQDEGAPTDVVALDAALVELAAINARCAQVVELKFFGGLENEDVAAVVGVSLATVKRDWSFAKAWLFQRLTTAEA